MCCSGLLTVALGGYGYVDDSLSLVHHSVPVGSGWHVRIWNVPSCFGISLANLALKERPKPISLSLLWSTLCIMQERSQNLGLC